MSKMFRLTIVLLGIATVGLAVSFSNRNQVRPTSPPEQLLPPLSKQEVDVLFQEFTARFAKVPVRNAADVAILRSVGLLIAAQRRSYVVVLGDNKRMKAAQSLGYTIKEPLERDYTRHVVHVWVQDAAALAILNALVPISIPIETLPGYVTVEIPYDFELEWVREAGFRLRD